MVEGYKNSLESKEETSLYKGHFDETDFFIGSSVGHGQFYAMSWLLNVTDLKLKMNVAYSDVVKIMWNDLKKCYTMANTQKIQQLKANIANSK